MVHFSPFTSAPPEMRTGIHAITITEQYTTMRAGASSTTLAALAVASLAGNSAAFVAPCSGSSSSTFLRKSPVHASTSSTATSMSLESEGNVARVALGTFLAGAAMIFAGGEAALADGSTAKFSLPPISQAKDRCVCACDEARHVFPESGLSVFLRIRRTSKSLQTLDCCLCIRRRRILATDAHLRAVRWDRRTLRGTSCTTFESAT